MHLTCGVISNFLQLDDWGPNIFKINELSKNHGLTAVTYTLFKVRVTITDCAHAMQMLTRRRLLMRTPLAGTGVVEDVRDSRLHTRHLSAALGTPLQGMFQGFIKFLKICSYRFFFLSFCKSQKSINIHSIPYLTVPHPRTIRTTITSTVQTSPSRCTSFSSRPSST